MIKPADIILFTGDSITDCGRARTGGAAAIATGAEPARLGDGYVQQIATRLAMQPDLGRLRIFNRGISGNRIYDLETRLETDLLALKPTVVSILIGINDTWRRYDSGLISEVSEFEASYRRILVRVRGELGARIVMLEPFLLPVPETRGVWREDLDPRITAIRRVAAEFAEAYVPLDELFAAAVESAPAASWLPDGVHPSTAGHSLIADAWMKAVARGPR